MLREAGPLDSAELGRHLAASGATKAKDPTAAVAQSLSYNPRFRKGRDGTWVYLPDLLQGSVFTHRLTAEEVEEEVIASTPDWTMLLGAHVDYELAGGGALQVRLADYDRGCARVVRGPSGWLAGAKPGELVGLRFEPDESVAVVPVDTVGPSPFTDKRLRDRIESDLELDPCPLLPGTSISEVVFDILRDDPTAFAAASPPLSERLAALGFETHHVVVGRPGTDWSAWDDDWDEYEYDDEDWDEYDALERDNAGGFDPGVAAAVRILLASADLTAEGHDTPDGLAVGLGELMAYPEVDEYLSAMLADFDHVAELAQVAHRSASVCQGLLRAAALHVEALCAETQGDDLAAEALALESLEADPTYLPALLHAARDAEDRGDAVRAVELLRCAGVPGDDPLRVRLQPLVDPPHTGMSRNAPCPCGSGRKHKACCLRSARHPLAARAPGLRARAVSWGLAPPRRLAYLPYGHAWIGSPDDIDAADAIDESPLLQDLATWGAGLLTAYRDRRAALLPDDERALLDEWAEVRPRVYEVLGHRPGRDIRLRDLITGAEYVVALPRTSRAPVANRVLLLARILPDGEGGWVMGGSVGVPRLARSDLVDLLRSGASDLEIAAWVPAAKRTIRT